MDMRTTLILLCLVVVLETKYISYDEESAVRPKKHVHHLGKHHAKRSKNEMLSSDLVSYDENNKPYVNCAYNMDGITGIKKCAIPDGETTFDMGYACFSLWNGEGNVMVQDCWIHQQVSLDQCEKKKCSASKSVAGVNFCCCFGHECNNNIEE